MQSDPSLVAAFTAATAGVAGIERRRMFGYPAVFLNGNMVCGLHRDGMVMRLAEADCSEMIDRQGATPFVAMGRTMRGWVVVPPGVLKSSVKLRRWLDKALAHAVAMPAKPPRRKSRAVNAG